MDMVCIKVKIGRKREGNRVVNDYPDFNRLHKDLRRDMDWSAFIDTFGTGWFYDKISGFGEADAENPDPNIQYGMIAVPEDFALAAVDEFPDQVTIEDEVELERFHDERATAHMPDERIDREVLDSIRAKHGITGSLEDERGRPASRITDSEKKALDPDHPAPGICKNWKKRWADLKARRGIKIVQPGGGK